MVFMVHTTELQHHLIASKIEEIKKELAETGAELPEASVSVGIVHGSEAVDAQTLFEKTDEAMYSAKKSGKHTYRFCGE